MPDVNQVPKVGFADPGTKEPSSVTSGRMKAAKSLNYMGPYDGHGKRGKTLVARIQGFIRYGPPWIWC